MSRSVQAGTHLAAALASMAPLAMAALGFALALPAPARAATAAPTAVVPAELALGSDVLPVSRRKSFLIPNRSTDKVLVFAPYSVDDFRTSWTASRSRSSRHGTNESQEAESKRSFSFALQGGAAAVLADCDERAYATGEGRTREALAAVPDHDLHCRLHVPVGGAFELSVSNGQGELTGTGGDSFVVTALERSSRWQDPAASGLLLRTSSGAPLAAVDFARKGRVVLRRNLESSRPELLAAAAAALLLADLVRW
ncbi:MAG TPA: hypothetical protein VGS57_03035 [Thermoanaerobaculia bacterium]|nr:hypothetical protein [Thermoanaerobaculia bacterium]